MLCESLFRGPKKAVERYKRVVHFEKFVIRETNMELGQLPSSRTKISEWKPFLSIRMLVICFSSFQIDHMMNLCKHLQIYENRCCCWYIVMLC